MTLDAGEAQLVGGAKPLFGVRVPGVRYVLRPGAYAIVVGRSGKLAVVAGRNGFHLPGGGLEAGEDPITALQREILEECGRGARIGSKIGRATQLLFAPGEGHFEIDAIFLRARFTGKSPAASEHALKWLSLCELNRMARECDVWAVQAALAAEQLKS